MKSGSTHVSILRTGLFLLMSLFMFRSGYGQRIQWAHQLVGFSSEFKDDDNSPRYRAIQALGKPDVLPQGGQSPCSWSPKKEKKGKEWIHVRFKESMQIQQVAIAESFRCGTIVGITLVDDMGVKHKIKSYTAPEPGQSTRMYRVMMPLTDYKVKEVIVYMKTALVDGWNHIDAIGISESKSPIKAKINTVPMEKDIELERLSDNVNSDYDDLKPTITPDGNFLFFVRKEHPDNKGVEKKDDIWYCEKTENGWSEAYQMGSPLNNNGHNFVNGVSPDGNVLLLGNIYGSGGNKGKGMSMSYLKDGVWGFPKGLNIYNFYNRSIFMEAHITSNFQAIVMAVWRNDTYGNKDIYVSFNKGNNNWSKPMNLGPMINTASAEMAPFLAADGKTLYYSTAGLSGYGNYDMYMSHRLDETWQNWSEPINMGPIINSKGHDAYLSLDAHGEYAFLSRAYNNSGTHGDIYKIHLSEKIRPEEMQIVEVDVEGLDDNVDAYLSYSGQDDPTCSGIAFPKKTVTGHVFHFSAQMKGVFYVVVEANGYKRLERKLDVGQSQTISLKMEKSH